MIGNLIGREHQGILSSEDEPYNNTFKSILIIQDLTPYHSLILPTPVIRDLGLSLWGPLCLTRQKVKGRNSSIKSDGTMQIFGGNKPRCFWNTTLSKKHRGVKMAGGPGEDRP